MTYRKTLYSSKNARCLCKHCIKQRWQYRKKIVDYINSLNIMSVSTVFASNLARNIVKIFFCDPVKVDTAEQFNKKKPSTRSRMYVFNVLIVFSTSQLAVTLGGLILYDTQSFLFDMMENDEKCAQILNIRIKIETSIVSISAQTVLHEMGMFTDANSRHGFEHNEVVGDGASSSEITVQIENGETATALTAHENSKFVIANALHVLAFVVSKHNEESDALEFGMTVVVSAISCQFLQFLAVMLGAISVTIDLESYETRYFIIGKYFQMYLDKMARLKQSLSVESDMYWQWVNLVAHSYVNSQPLTSSDLSSIRNLVDKTIYTLCDCENISYKSFIDKYNSKAELWSNPIAVSLVFEEFHQALQKLFESIPVGTMESGLRDMYFNRVYRIHS